MIQAVLDANVFVSGFPAKAGVLAELIDRWRLESFRLVVSEHILEEVARAWMKPYWRARFSETQAERALMLLRTRAEVTPLTAEVSGVATHTEDDLVLATAASGAVDFLVTGDNKLQLLGSYMGIVILSPRDFLSLLEREAESNNGR